MSVMLETESPGRPSALRLAWLGIHLAFGSLVLALIATMALAVVPRFLGYPTFVVTGGSMGDSLPLGSIALTHRVRANNVGVGDILVVESGGATGHTAIAHRVVAIDTEPGIVIFATKGDANQAADPAPVLAAESRRVPSVAGYVPVAGYAVGFVQTPAGWTLLVLLPSAIMCLDLIRAIWTDDRRRGAPPGRSRIWRWRRWAT